LSEAGGLSICILTAVYNDWPSLSRLLSDIETEFAGECVRIDMVVVNDASTSNMDDFSGWTDRPVIRSITVLDLRANFGNQFAVATGLRYVTEHLAFDAVMVMDADGEDTVPDARRLVKEWRANRDAIVVARREKRSESALFKLFYALYQLTFRLLTGRTIAFGNFSVLPRALAPAIAGRPELPHHYSATLLRSKLPLVEIATERGRRYAGKSSMNFPGLVFHAVAGLSVFSEVLLSRLLIATATIGSLCGIGIIFVIVFRLFTSLAFPNWATTVISFLALLASQSILLILSSGFLLVLGRSSMLLTSLETARMVRAVRSYGAVATADVQASNVTG
jgi:glycosyltransferase involved in cell wall biosynthesis